MGYEIGPYADVPLSCKLVNCCIEGKLGERTVVWRWAHVMDGAVVGADCMLAQGVFVGPDTTIGDRCRIQNNASMASATVGNDVYIGPNVVLANARHPSLVHPNGKDLDRIVIQDGASIGANAVILGGVTIGIGAAVGAGAVVLQDVPEGALAVGVPAVVKA